MPNIIVLFELKPTPEGRARYLELAAMLKPLLSGFEGFVRAERFESLADHSKLLSMNVWTDVPCRTTNPMERQVLFPLIFVSNGN